MSLTPEGRCSGCTSSAVRVSASFRCASRKVPSVSDGTASARTALGAHAHTSACVQPGEQSTTAWVEAEIATHELFAECRQRHRLRPHSAWRPRPKQLVRAAWRTEHNHTGPKPRLLMLAKCR